MSKQFAEKVLDTIYAKAQKHDGTCYISGKQYDIVSECIHFNYCDPMEVNSRAYGNLGRYYVELYQYHGEFTCQKIILRDEAEVEAERKAEAEAKAKEDAIKAGFATGTYVGEPKKRMDLVLTLASEHEFEGYYGLTRVYEFADENGNCIVWFTGNTVGCYDESGQRWTPAKVGDTVEMRATVKEHKEYRGTKQTIINRPKINAIR